jgi:hypothetical protein
MTAPSGGAVSRQSPFVSMLSDADGFEVRRRGRRPGVRWESVAAFVERCRLSPGAAVPGSPMQSR